VSVPICASFECAQWLSGCDSSLRTAKSAGAIS
jgi:hypothetical protein